jgi:hypothetical protein
MSAVAFLQERTLRATEIAQHRETLVNNRMIWAKPDGLDSRNKVARIGGSPE